jgi:L-ribulose-5-phosphate 3-epimerase UlaE
MKDQSTSYSCTTNPGLYFFLATLEDHEMKIIVKNDYEGISEDEAWNGGGDTAYEDTFKQLKQAGLKVAFLNEQTTSEDCLTRQELSQWFKPEDGFFNDATIKIAFVK